ncbi:hypothetical protein [Jannaschia sp. 2305UL9-9]|uniref:hypothetical protein n=1 Tax=Jannaschia sp. 2305UL9-9 TaxID=3121638 RepID=UPI003527AC7B
MILFTLACLLVAGSAVAIALRQKRRARARGIGTYETMAQMSPEQRQFARTATAEWLYWLVASLIVLSAASWAETIFSGGAQ